jgi:hypothetical protein
VAAPAKQDPKKGGMLEEITDNRPRQITYTKDFSAEQGGQGLRITEDIAKRFAESFMKIEVFEIHRETLAETLKETIKLDLSCLLYPKQKINVSLKYLSHSFICLIYFIIV